MSRHRFHDDTMAWFTNHLAALSSLSRMSFCSSAISFHLSITLMYWWLVR